MISVCMATYNGERFIREQIDSILSQLSDEDELVISDDGSTDKTLEIIDSYKDGRIKVFHHERNSNYKRIRRNKSFYYVTSNFENALKQAKGDFIFLSDQDDVWVDGKKKVMLEKIGDAELAMCNLSVIDENGNVKIKRRYEKSPIPTSFLAKIYCSKHMGCCMLLKRSLLKKILPFPKMLIAQDFWIGLLADSFVFVQEPLQLYRRHSGNVSPATHKSPNPLWYKIFYRLVILRLVLKRKAEIKRK